jgi:protein AroM
LHFKPKTFFGKNYIRIGRLMMRPVIGFATIGQSPRTDVVPEIMKIIEGYEVLFVEAGALDDLSREEIEKNLRPESGDTVYVTRLRDGSEVKISKKKLIPLLEKKIWELDKKVDLIAILCSGEFPDFDTIKPVIYPDKILKGIASSIGYKGRIAIFIPAEEQVEYAYKKWGEYFENLIVIPISPYTSSLTDFEKIGEKLKTEGINLAIMDCIGYTDAQRNIIKKTSGNIRVISTRRALARVLSELI